MYHNFDIEKRYTSDLDLAQIDQVVCIGFGSYHVLDKYDSKGGGCVWLVVQRLPSRWRDAGLPFRLMVAKHLLP